MMATKGIVRSLSCQNDTVLCYHRIFLYINGYDISICTKVEKLVLADLQDFCYCNLTMIGSFCPDYLGCHNYVI